MEIQNKILPSNTIPKRNISWKVWALAFSSFLFQSLTWIALHRALMVHPSAAEWILTAAIAAIAVSITTFFLLVQRSRLLANSLFVLSAIIYVLVSPLNMYVWIGGGIFCVFALWYEQRVWREAQSRVDFAVIPVISSSVTVLLYGIMLLMGFNIYYNVSTDFKTNPDKYYERLGQQAAKTIPYFTKALIPDGVSLNDSFEAIINKEAQNRPEYKYSSEFERQILINEARKAFQNQFQITASNDDTLADIVAQVTINKIRQAMEPYQNYLPVIFAILITSLLYTFAFLIRWLVIIFSWILFRILIMTSFFRLEKVQVEVEKLTI
jgi:hypothetical protein